MRCAVREQLIGWLYDHHPYALPRVATAPAALPPGSQWPYPTRHAHEKPSDLDGSPRTGRG